MKTMSIAEAKKTFKFNNPTAKKALDLLAKEPKGSYRLFAVIKDETWRADDDYVLLFAEEEIEYIKVFA